jgi:hypothetical protein
VTEAALNAQINNQGAIQAEGGRVVMSAKAANQLIDTVINQNGIVKAQGLIERNGEIILDGGDNGAVNVSGTLSTDGQHTGGTINITGKTIQINNGATVTASGEAGGGVISIGNKQTTQQTRIAENASVNAIALDHGNAGTINVLANINNGTVNVAGNLNATALKTGNGGRIDTSAANVKIADSAKINTQAKNGNSGTWLIDPYDFTIAATGGEITGAALSTALTGNNVTIQTGALSATCTGATCGAGNSAGNGDIFVKDVITWAANNLTLSAYRNINIDSNLNGSGTAQLALEYGQGALAAGNTSDYFVHAAVNLPAGNNFSTKLGSDGAVTNYTVITALGVVNDATTTSLQGIQNNLTGNYALGGNIDATPAQNWVSATGTGFEPIGGFTGQLHGLGHTISNLRTSLFSTVWTRGRLRDIGLINTSSALVGSNYGSINNVYATGTITGTSYVGGLVGYNRGTISNAYATGSVSGHDNVGGLVGYNRGTISNAYATGSVSGHDNVGGLVGYNSDYLSNYFFRNIINNAYATGNVSGNDNVGGLAGENYGSINNAYATGSVSGNDNVGGLAGGNYNTIKNAYATGSVSGNDNIGGLLGSNSDYFDSRYNRYGIPQYYYYSTATINNAYATGNVSGNDNIGGLVGSNNHHYFFSIPATTIINNAYATGNVSGNDNIGGLVGSNSDYFDSRDYLSFWHPRYYYITAINNAYATGNVSGNDNIGGLVGSNNSQHDYVFLLPANTIISNAFWNTETTGKDINSGIGLNQGTLILNNVLGKTTAEMEQLATFSNAGWDIANTGGSTAIWRIYEGQTMPLLRSFLTPLTINNVNKTYNGLSDSVLSYSIDSASTSGHLFNQADPYNGAKNVGSYTAKMLYSDQQGYDISYVDGVLTINKADLTITANDVNKVYDGLSYYGGNGVRYSGFVNDETNAVLFGNLRYGGSSQGAINAGDYSIIPSGLSADNYQISYQDGRLTIDPVLLIDIKQPELLNEKQPELLLIDRKQPAPIRYNLEDQLVPLQVSTTFTGKQKTQPIKHDSKSNIVIENEGIKLPNGIPFIAR